MKLDFTGERFCPEIRGEIYLEHYLRYLLASSLATDKDVLDIASGEGYGSYIMAQKARSVIGVDISAEAVEHAIETYKKDNLSFRTGDAAQIPLPDASVDLVVSFETIEHHDRQEEMLDEIRRVLRPDGVLVISSPERSVNEDLNGHNPFHVRELYRHELEDLLARRFSHIAFLGQRTIFASMIWNKKPGDLHVWPTGAPIDPDIADSAPEKPKYHIAIATNAPDLPHLPDGILEGEIDDAEAYARYRGEAREMIDKLAAHSAAMEKNAAWQEENAAGLARRNDELEKSRQELEKYSGELERLKAWHEEHSRELERHNGELAAWSKELESHNAELEGQNKDLGNYCKNLESHNAELEEQNAEFAAREKSLLVEKEDLTAMNTELASSLAAREEDLAGARAMIDSMVNSRSWRLTAPMRAVKKNARGVLGQCALGACGLLGRIVTKKGRILVIFDYEHEQRGMAIHAALAGDYDARYVNVHDLRRELVFAHTAELIIICGATQTRLLTGLVRGAKNTRVAVDSISLTDFADHEKAGGDFMAAIGGAQITRLDLPPSVDDNFRRACFSAVKKTDGLLRIGLICHEAPDPALLEKFYAILLANPAARLVIFGTQLSGGLDQRISGQIESRPWPRESAIARDSAGLEIAVFPGAFESMLAACAFMGISCVVAKTALPGDSRDKAADCGTGFFVAKDDAELAAFVANLAGDEDLRHKSGRAIKRRAFWLFSHLRLCRASLSAVGEILGNDAQRAAIFAREHAWQKMAVLYPDVPVVDYGVVQSSGPALARSCVVIPLYNYENYIVEALESLKSQTRRDFDVVVVNDASTDNSEKVAGDWLFANKDVFASVTLLRNNKNSGLSATRNSGIDYAGSSFIMLLDADNVLLPGCMEICSALIEKPDTAFVFPQIEAMGGASRLISGAEWHPAHLRYRNYIDAMAMIRKSAWAAVGGYTVQNLGWEDYDLWCKFVDFGFYGLNAGQVLALYRVHDNSMLSTTTNKAEAKSELLRFMRQRHPWLKFEQDFSRTR